MARILPNHEGLQRKLLPPKMATSIKGRRLLRFTPDSLTMKMGIAAFGEMLDIFILYATNAVM
jgi:hypothetical protein